MTDSLMWSVVSGETGLDDAAIRDTWRADPAGNPFCAPAFLRAMGETGSALGRVPVTAFGKRRDGTAAAVWPFALDRKNTLRFVQHEYAYHCTAIAPATLESEELGSGLAAVLAAVEPSGVALVHVPQWGRTLDAVRAALRASGWRARVILGARCPALDTDSAEELRTAFAKQRGRQRWNKLRRARPDVTLEVRTDAEGVEEWSREFCDAHQRRWEDTATPSMYRDPAARDLLRQVLTAWSHDELAIRFALRSAGEGLAFAVALRAGRRFLWSHMAIAPAGLRLGVGTALTWLAGCWAGENRFATFDFGVGGEAYKYRYANRDEPLWRVFAGPRRFSPVYARGVIEERIRATPALERAWNRLVNRGLRHRVISLLGAWRRLASDGHRR